MIYAVTGATGQLGRKVIESLKARVPLDEIVAIVRKPALGETLGVPYRVADYGDPQTLAAAFAGVDELLFISSSTPGLRQAEHHEVVRAAATAGIGHVAYTSCLHADRWTISFTEDHLMTERWLAESGLPHTILRNGWYWENNTDRLAGALATGALVGASGGAEISWASRQDLADAAVAILLGDPHRGQVLELAGDRSYRTADIAAEASRQTGRAIVDQDVPEAAFAQILSEAGVPAPVASMVALIEAQGVSTGILREDNGLLGRIIGRPTQNLADAVAEVLPQAG